MYEPGPLDIVVTNDINNNIFIKQQTCKLSLSPQFRDWKGD